MSQAVGETGVVELQPVVYVVDDDRAVRESLEWLLGSVGLRCQAFDSGPAFLERFNDGQPGCLVLDVRLPGMSGLDLHDHLVGQGAEIPTIMITGHGDVSMAVKAMKAGIVDFIEKPFTDQALLDRIRVALERDSQSRQTRAQRKLIQDRVDQLTTRERQVMDGVVLGKLNKQIATELKLSHKTVEVHRARMMEKMQASSLADLVRITMLWRGNGS